MFSARFPFKFLASWSASGPLCQPAIILLVSSFVRFCHGTFFRAHPFYSVCLMGTRTQREREQQKKNEENWWANTKRTTAEEKQIARRDSCTVRAMDWVEACMSASVFVNVGYWTKLCHGSIGKNTSKH